MLCVVVYRPYSDPHSRVRGSNRASYIPRVRGYRRGYAIATLYAYSSDPRALLVLADFASTAPKTAAVRLRSTGAPHRSKGAFHTYRWAFSPQPVGRIDVGHVQLVIRLSRRPPLPELPWAVARILRVVSRSETRVSESSAGPTRTLEPQHARAPLRVETDLCPPTPSVSPAPILELGHGADADGHSGEYLRRLEVLSAVWHAGGREGTVRCIQGRLWGSQHCRNHQRRLLEVHLVESAERSKRVSGAKL